MKTSNKLWFSAVILACVHLAIAGGAVVVEDPVAVATASVTVTPTTGLQGVGVVGVVTGQTPAVTLAAGEEKTVNINTATASQIAEALQGIGIKKAEAIVAYRETYGYFTSVDDLVAVRGIGNTILYKVRDLIVLE